MSQQMERPLFRNGRLLAASPLLLDPHFQRAVIIIIEHTDEGALGVVLNQPTEILATDALPAPLSELIPATEYVHCGGPVQPNAVIIVGAFSDPTRAAGLIFDAIGVLQPDSAADDITEHVSELRVFGGYAGWGPGQLEAEFGEGAWIDIAATRLDIFNEAPDTLWSDVLARKGPEYAIFGRAPEDPSLN